MLWNTLPDSGIIKKTISSLKERGINTIFLQNKEEALNEIKRLIPSRSQVMTGGSLTLKEIGFIDLMKSNQHNWMNLKNEILAEQDPVQQLYLRKKSTTSDFFLGSVHAIAQSGELVIASASGSQIPSYAYSSNNVIWVVGAQKIVINLEEGLKRVREYCLPNVDKRAKKNGKKGSYIGKILIIEQEKIRRSNLTLMLINQKLGI
jgi:L-lactate utilization protein LutC